MDTSAQHDRALPQRDDGASARDGARALDATERNRLLRALPTDEYERILPEFEPVEVAARQILWKPGVPIRSVYFPRTFVASLLTPLTDEMPVEAATVGLEGMVGVAVVLGVASSASLAVVQVSGEGLRLDAHRLRQWVSEGAGTLPPLLLRYAYALQEQTAQSVACNRRHEMEERCARWLLMTHDRAGADTFVLTHEFLASMLGVRRASVTVAAGLLQRAGLIRYSRGKITVVDRAGLEQASCECYHAVRERYQRTVGVPAF